MLFGDGDAEQAGAVQVLVVLGREFRLAVVGRGAAGEHGLAEFARAVAMIAACSSFSRNACGIEDRRVQPIASAVGALLLACTVIMPSLVLRCMVLRK